MGFHPDMGNLPSWIGAGSLLLAFRIFLRDRSSSDRAQVDAVGIWGDINREAVSPGKPRNDDIRVQIHIRNATDLPVEVHSLAFTFQARWVVPSFSDELPGPGPDFREETPGKADTSRFFGPIGIAPQKTWDSQWITVNMTHTAPADSASLVFTSDGVKCVIKYALIVDNAGRRWETRQRQGKPARRVRWHTHSGEYYPAEWQNVLGRRFRVLKSKAKGRIRDIRTQQASITGE
jgi:hypothetical protein